MGFKSGALNRIFWEPSVIDSNGDLSDSGVETEVFNFQHDWEESDEGHEVTSSCHLGVQAFIASILRGSGNARFHIRSATVETLPGLGIRAQASGWFTFEFGNRAPVYIPCYISRVAWANETAGGTDVACSFKLNGEVGEYSA